LIPVARLPNGSERAGKERERRAFGVAWLELVAEAIVSHGPTAGIGARSYVANPIARSASRELIDAIVSATHVRSR
jgi:hypothetical protein